LSSLSDILSSIDWADSAARFAGERALVDTIEKGCQLVAVWNQELSFYDRYNTANPFLQEMKASLFYVPACLALGLNKPAAASLRTAVESALYYTYFKDHEMELMTLRRNRKYYLTRSKIVDYHNTHTREFQKRQMAVGLVGELNQWYGRISAVVHGQIPGVWTSHSLSDTSFSKAGVKEFMKEFNVAVKIVNRLFLATISDSAWEGISSQARQLFLKELSVKAKGSLGLTVV
jgi:hypothetical protein